MNLLSIIIPCKNERMNLRACIASARLVADEIIVADSGSVDGSLEIARDESCRIIERDYIDSGSFKNWAIPQARHSWVMILDADERITSQLAHEIRNVLSDPVEDGYWVFRDNYFLGYLVRHSGWGNDKVLRLFRRDLGRYERDMDHSEVIVSTGHVGTLKHRLTHFTAWSYDQYLPKMHRYADQQAQRWMDEGRKPSLLGLLIRGPLRFLRAYVINRGFLDGAIGFQVSALTGIYSYLKQARLWAKYHGRPQPDPKSADRVTPTSRAA
jgi:glycosyltransferase involved in cell wall biosynthesis